MQLIIVIYKCLYKSILKAIGFKKFSIKFGLFSHFLIIIPFSLQNKGTKHLVKD